MTTTRNQLKRAAFESIAECSDKAEQALCRASALRARGEEDDHARAADLESYALQLVREIGKAAQSNATA